MAIEYAKVLNAQSREFTVIGRSAHSAAEFTRRMQKPVVTGGLHAAIESGRLTNATSAIVSVGIEALAETSIALLKSGVTRLLIEKPGILHPSEIDSLREAATRASASVFIAYNRRFLSSVLRAREIIAEDGGLTSFTFDFTEWAHEIEKLKKSPGVKDRWVLGNSSHVLDLAFHLGGAVRELSAKHSGVMDWHRSAAVFVGSGLTVAGTPFSYHANWDAPGRWGLEFMTAKHKLILRPLEKLQMMHKGSVEIEEVTIKTEDVRFDFDFKPGLYRQVEAFFSSETGPLCTLDEMCDNLKNYMRIAGYK